MNRAHAIELAEMELLIARRRIAHAAIRPEGVPMAAQGLRRAAKMFVAAGMMRRAEAVWRFAYRMSKRQPASKSETLEDALAEWRFGGRAEGGEV